MTDTTYAHEWPFRNDDATEYDKWQYDAFRSLLDMGCVDFAYLLLTAPGDRAGRVANQKLLLESVKRAALAAEGKLSKDQAIAQLVELFSADGVLSKEELLDEAESVLGFRPVPEG